MGKPTSWREIKDRLFQYHERCCIPPYHLWDEARLQYVVQYVVPPVAPGGDVSFDPRPIVSVCPTACAALTQFHEVRERLFRVLVSTHVRTKP